MIIGEIMVVQKTAHAETRTQCQKLPVHVDLQPCTPPGRFGPAVGPEMLGCACVVCVHVHTQLYFFFCRVELFVWLLQRDMDYRCVDKSW